MFFVFSGVWTFLVDAYPGYAASALAANSFARCMFAGAFPLFGDQSSSPPHPSPPLFPLDQLTPPSV